MEQCEKLVPSSSRVEIRENQTGYEVRGLSYCLQFSSDTPYISLGSADNTPWVSLFKGSSIITSENADPTYRFEQPECEVRDDGSIAVHIRSYGELGRAKNQTWICRDDFIETYVTAKTSGDLKEIVLLGGTLVQPNMFGQSVSERHFQRVYNPQPSEMERPVISALESTRITTGGMWKPGRRREFLISPYIFGFSSASSDATDEQWLMASISAPIEAQTMVDYRYDVHEDGFSLRIGYDETPIDEPLFTSPSLLLHFAPDTETGLTDATRHWQALGHLPQLPSPPKASWHTGVKYVTWGSQLEQERKMRDIGVDIQARDIVNEGFVAHQLETLEEHGITIDTITLDDKWQKEYGTNTPDPDKWKDMPRFITMQHELGRRTLLWMKLFDPEGLPPEACIVDTEGRPIASDPTNPNYLSLVHEQVHAMLAPSGLGADGLKLDFLAQLPHGPGLRWHGNARGLAALHEYMRVINDAARAAKKNALVEAQVINPWFADVFNQVRLNDTNERHSVTRTMGNRARLSLTLLPNHSIDPDGWPMRDKATWREYIAAQPLVPGGGVTTHFVDSVGDSSFTKKDMGILRKAVQRVRKYRND